MKRKITAVLSAALCICFLASACTGKEDDADIVQLLYRLCEVGGQGSEDTAAFYFDDVTASKYDGLRVRSSEDFGFLYDGIFAEPVCYNRIENYAIRLPLDTSGFEVHIMRCVNLSDCAEVQAMLSRRLDKMQNAEIREYAPENYEICFTGATVYAEGRYVFLISTYDNEAVIKEIKRAL